MAVSFGAPIPSAVPTHAAHRAGGGHGARRARLCPPYTLSVCICEWHALCGTSSHFMEPVLVFAMVRSHEPVPDVEINTIIAAPLFMVLRMIRRRVHEFAQPRVQEPRRVKLVTGVTEHGLCGPPHHEEPECQRMHRHAEDQQGKEARMHERLQRSKAKRRPRAGI